MSSVVIEPGPKGRLRVIVPYDWQRVMKIKTIPDRRWHPQEKYWTVPDTGTCWKAGVASSCRTHSTASTPMRRRTGVGNGPSRRRTDG